jgi:phosphoadenosine phosphosulfate reductase
MPHILSAAKTASAITDRVLVSFSGGKDSIVTLDLCCRYFGHVEAFFMYLVKGLSWQDELINYYSRRYGIIIHQIPHFMLSEWLRYGVLRAPDPNVKVVSVAETYTHIRQQTGIYWIAGGERISDSIWRRAMMKSRGGSVDKQRGRFYPIAEWRKSDVLKYMKLNQLPRGRDSKVLGFSFRGLDGKDLYAIREHFPADYAKIKAQHPLVDAEVKRYEWYGKDQETQGEA